MSISPVVFLPSVMVFSKAAISLSVLFCCCLIWCRSVRAVREMTRNCIFTQPESVSKMSWVGKFLLTRVFNYTTGREKIVPRTRMARKFRGQKFSRTKIFADKPFRDLIFEDRHAALAPPTFKVTTPIAQQSGNLLAYNLTVASTTCSAARLPIFGLQFGSELGVALSLSPTVSALLSNTLCTFS